MKVTFNTKQLYSPFRAMLAEELARTGCVIKENEVTVTIPDFTIFLSHFLRFLEKVSKNEKCIVSHLVRLCIAQFYYVIVESETTHRRIVVSIWYGEEEKGMRYTYVRDE